MYQLKQLLQRLLHKEPTVENNNEFLYTEEQLMARLKFFIGICLSLTLTGIVFVVLYSLIFVTQPLNAISPIDQKFFELIVPIATFLTGTLTSNLPTNNSTVSVTPAFTPSVTTGFGGKEAPVQPPHPEI